MLYRNAKVITFEDNTKVLSAVYPLNYLVTRYKDHVVAEGDTLFSLARQYYNNTFLWYHIAEANRVIDPVYTEVVTSTTVTDPIGLVAGNTIVIPILNGESS